MTTDRLIYTITEKGIQYIEDKIPIPNCKGLYFDNIIVVDSHIETQGEKRCILAEELGHYETSSGQILDDAISSRQQEKKARNWAYEYLIKTESLLKAYEKGYRNRYEIADYLDVTESFLEETLAHYAEKYGPYMELQGYLLYFQPLGVMRVL